MLCLLPGITNLSFLLSGFIQLNFPWSSPSTGSESRDQWIRLWLVIWQSVFRLDQTSRLTGRWILGILNIIEPDLRYPSHTICEFYAKNNFESAKRLKSSNHMFFCSDSSFIHLQSVNWRKLATICHLYNYSQSTVGTPYTQMPW